MVLNLKNVFMFLLAAWHQWKSTLYSIQQMLLNLQVQFHFLNGIVSSAITLNL